MKRSIIIKSNDGEILDELELSKVTSVKTSNEMIHLDKLKDGTWRMIFNENLIPDIQNISRFEIHRED